MRLSTILWVFLTAALAFSGFLYYQTQKTITVPVLAYHKFGPANNSVWTVDLGEFRKQMESLKAEGYSSILPKDLVANRRWGRPLPSKPVIITIDDGNACVTNAEPILKEYGFTAIVYLITDLVASNGSKRCNWAGAPCLVWEEVRAADSRGVLSFGGHSASHVILGKLQDPSEEIRRCFNDLRRGLGRKPDSMAYPYTFCSDTLIAHMEKSRFTTGMIGEDSVAVLKPGSNLYKIPRVGVIGADKSFSLSGQDFDAEKRRLSLSYTGPKMKVMIKVSADGCLFHNNHITLASGTEVLVDNVPGGAKDLLVEIRDKSGTIPYYCGNVSI